MKFTPNNFLKFVKELVTGDEGFFKDKLDLLGLSVLATSVTRIVDGNGFPVLNAAATITAVAAVSFVVPRDYDEFADELLVTFAAKMGGATDVPALTLVSKRAVLATAAVTLTASAASTALGTSAETTAALSATDQSFTVKYKGQGLTRGQVVLLTLTSGAHTTDALQLTRLGVTYRSTLVSYQNGTSLNPLR